MSNKPEQFKNRLKQNLDEIRRNLAHVSETAKPVELDQNRVGRLSRMDAMQGQAMAQASRQREQQQVRLIQAALQRIELGQFGDCLECNDAIGIARLNIDPATQYCIQCAESFENK